MPQIAKVAVAAATYAIDKPYDYLIPQGTDIAVGMRVLAPFGRGNRVSEGVVLALGQGVPDKPIKPIRSVVDREPVITDREIRLALWMRERYFCTFYDAIRTILPAAVWYSYREMWSLTGEPLPEDLSEREAAACRLLQDGPMERDDLCAALGETGSRVLSALKKRGLLQMEPQGSRKVQDRVVQIACLALEPEEALERMERKKKSAARQYDAVAFLAKYGDAVVQELCYYTGVSRQGIRSLERAGLVSLRSQEEYRISRRDYDAAAEEITLNDEQQRAYDEINEFERELTDAGTVVVKFWVQIDKDTQLARFRERQNTPEKQWKITEEDWRNREKWDAYEEAVDEMLARTSTERAPWHILESVDKRYARIKAMRLVIGAIRQTLDR